MYGIFTYIDPLKLHSFGMVNKSNDVWWCAPQPGNANVEAMCLIYSSEGWNPFNQTA